MSNKIITMGRFKNKLSGKPTYEGYWENSTHNDVKGTMKAIIPNDRTGIFNSQIQITYNKSSPVNPGKTVYMTIKNQIINEQTMVMGVITNSSVKMKSINQRITFDMKSIDDTLEGTYHLNYPNDNGSFKIKLVKSRKTSNRFFII